MRAFKILLFAGLATSCGPKEAPVEAAPTVEADPWAKPGPLPKRAFTLPTVHEATLSNGVQVRLVEQHELPLVDLRLVFNVGSFTDPSGQEGLASASMDMLNEGAGDLDAVGYARALKELATKVGSGAGLDSANVTLSALKRNLEPSLDLWASALLEPRFDDKEWERIRKQRIQEVTEARTTPTSMASRVMDRVMYGDAYDGRLTSADSYGAISTSDMSDWAGQNLVPANAILLVGGDVTMEELLPLLEARLSGWQGGEAAAQPSPSGVQPTESVLYLVDKPGAAQSVIRAGRFVGSQQDEGYPALEVGNDAWGGSFMARLNMNLREDKGYTYGARSGLGNDLAGAHWAASTSVKTEVTVDSMKEILKELSEVSADRPLTDDEVAYFKSSKLNGYPGRFETTSYLLQQLGTVWRYGLPADWIEQVPARVEGVNPTQAQQAFNDMVATQPLAFVVVGDLAVIQPTLEPLGLPMVLLDADGAPVN